MTTADMIEELIEKSVRAYKKNSKGCSEWNKLNRHETVIINGIPFNYWREYAVYKVCQYIEDKIPEAKLECNLEGNNSNIRLELTDEQQKKLNSLTYSFLKSF